MNLKRGTCWSQESSATFSENWASASSQAPPGVRKSSPLRGCFLSAGFPYERRSKRQARSMLDRMPGERFFSVRYEELLANPQTILREACSFCGLPVSDARLREVTASIKPGRAFSYQGNADLVQFAQAHKDRLHTWGYLP